MKKTLTTKKKTVLVSLLFVIGLFSIWFFVVRSSENKQTGVPNEGTPETINYGPATDEEKQQAEDNKQRIVEEQDAQNNNPEQPSGLRQVTVTVTSADKNSVFASVNGVVEDGGTCTATFTNGSQTLSATSESIANVSYTQCGRIQPPALNGGNWSVTVSYKSATAQGSSEPFRME